MKFRAKFEVSLQNHFGQSLPLKSLEIWVFYGKLISREQGNSFIVLHRNFPKYSNDQRQTRLKLTQILQREKHRIPCHYSAMATINQANSCNFKTLNWIYGTYSADFPCHFKVISDKPALTFRRWKSKTGKRLTITANFQEWNLGTVLGGEKNPARGPYRKSWTGHERLISQSNSRI